MITDKFGQQIYKEKEILSTLMKNDDNTGPFLVDDISSTVINASNSLLGYTALIEYIDYEDYGVDVPDFDKALQSEWYMPIFYKNMDIAEHILNLCNNNEELQRCGEELLLYQEHNLFDLLKYMVYLVDTMIEHNVIWGVGRGSSVSSFVLYKLNVHRINSLKYNLQITDFLRN